jgi:hypothetical protein
VSVADEHIQPQRQRSGPATEEHRTLDDVRRAAERRRRQRKEEGRRTEQRERGGRTRTTTARRPAQRGRDCQPAQQDWTDETTAGIAWQEDPRVGATQGKAEAGSEERSELHREEEQPTTADAQTAADRQSPNRKQDPLPGEDSSGEGGRHAQRGVTTATAHSHRSLGCSKPPHLPPPYSRRHDDAHRTKRQASRMMAAARASGEREHGGETRRDDERDEE